MNQVDPMADKYSSHTPYNYSFNSPVDFNDPNGADPDQLHNQVFRPVIGDNGTAGGPSIVNDFSTLFDQVWGSGGYGNVGGVGSAGLSDNAFLNADSYFGEGNAVAAVKSVFGIDVRPGEVWRNQNSNYSNVVPYVTPDSPNSNLGYGGERFYDANGNQTGYSISRVGKSSGGGWLEGSSTQIVDFFALSDESGDGRGSAESFLFGFAIVFGMSGEWGVVRDETGNSKWYWTVSANFGLGLDLGFNKKEIIPTNGNKFRVDQYQGRGKTFSLGVGFTSEARGGNTSDKATIDPFDFGDKYKERSNTFSPLIGIPLGISDAGGMYQISKTEFFK